MTKQEPMKPVPPVPSASAQEPVLIGPIQKRRVFDYIRGAYDLGYNDARDAKAVPGDNAPGYKGKDVEKDHGEALVHALNNNHPAPAIADFSDAYQGAREDLAIWKKRALEAEELNRKFIADINGHTFMGEPVPAAAINEQLLEALKGAVQAMKMYNLLYEVPKFSATVTKGEAAIAAAEAEKGGV